MSAREATGAGVLDLVSDFVCPWCWVAKRQLDLALAQVDSAAPPTLRAYRLDPQVPPGGVPYRDYMAARFASPDAKARLDTMRTHLLALGEELDMTFDFDAIKIRPDTLRAHCVQRWAAGQGLGMAMAERLFSAFFAEGCDIGDVDTLAALAADIGLDRDLVAELLNSGRDADVILQEEAVLRRIGVQGVPVLIGEHRQAISGAQGTEAFVAFLQS